MRVKDWGFSEIDGLVADASDAKLLEAAEAVAKEVRRNCPVGTVTHPIYRRGKYAGQNWTSRDAGRLKKSIRVVKKKEQGRRIYKKRDIRVYAGHYMAWYASVVEFYTPFVRPGITAAMPEIRRILSGKL